MDRRAFLEWGGAAAIGAYVGPSQFDGIRSNYEVANGDHILEIDWIQAGSFPGGGPWCEMRCRRPGGEWQKYRPPVIETDSGQFEIDISEWLPNSTITMG